MDDRPCPNHPPPSTLASITCNVCGAWKLNASDPLIYYETGAFRDVRLVLQEDERQAILLALAHLAVARPGWDHYLNGIAVRIDNATSEGRAKLYDEFRELRKAGGR